MGDLTVSNSDDLATRADGSEPDDLRGGAVIASEGCASCNGTGAAGSPASPSFIYALGRIDARFPNLSVEKEYAQALGRKATTGLNDRQAFHASLALRENRYLARQLCWVLTVQGMDSYLLVLRDPAELDLMVNGIAPGPAPLMNAVIGVRGPVAPVGYCNGLSLPIVLVDQMYTFDRASFVSAVPKPPSVPAESFAPAVEELFDRVLQLTDNAGATDEHRALNYLAMRYPAVYSKVAEEYAANCSLDGVDSKVSRLSGARTVIDVILQFTDRAVGVQKKYFVRVDVTEEFPFIVTKLSPYFDR